MEAKQFIPLQLFEIVYMLALAVIPFLMAIPAIGGTCFVVMVTLGARSIYRKCTFRKVPGVDNKAVVITGCDSGFGLSLSKRLTTAGFTVYACCLNEDSDGALKLKEMGSVKVIPLDVTSDQSVSEAYQRIKVDLKSDGLWCLVNNAGVGNVADVEFCAMETYKHVTDVNLFGMIRVTKMFTPLIRKEHGRIVNVTSVASCFPGHSAHAMSKAGCSAFSVSLRRELRKFGVTVIQVEPGNFYGATGFLNKNALESLEKDFEKQWDEADETVQEVYGKKYLQLQHQITAGFASTSCKSLRPVVDSLEHAVISTKPNLRYVVDGSNSVDIYTLLTRLSSFLPESWVDSFHNRELSPMLSVSH